jgi:hypothetical protein
MKALRIGLVLLSIVGLSACAVAPVSPWEKGTLAKPEMALTPDALASRAADHMYFSKEAASGGAAAGGGGCGCN